MFVDGARRNGAAIDADPAASVARFPSSGEFDAVIKDTVGRRLQVHYSPLTTDPLPDIFLRLLDQLSEQPRG